MPDHTPTGFSRRRFLVTGAAGVALSGCSADESRQQQPHQQPHGGSVSPYGRQQAGIARPQPPQRNLQLSVWDVEPSDIAGLVAELGRLAAELMTAKHRAVRDFEPARLTVTVGLGPSTVRKVDEKLPGADDLPRFAREEYDAARWQGDLAIQTCSDDPALQAAAVAVLHQALRDHASLRWSQTGARGEARDDGSTRNLLGFVDGTIGPRSAKELADNVWIDGSRARDGAVMVARRMRVDAGAFLVQSIDEQERAIGRRRDSGGPLPGSKKIESKGSIGDELDLEGKTADGQYVVPVAAHARRAHPKYTGSHVMLRRSYSFDDGPDDTGLLFISFQKDLRTFVATQRRLDEQDDLMEFTSTTAAGTFLVLPGFSKDTELGHQVFER